MPERQVITSLVGTIAPLLTVDTCDTKAIDYASIYLPRMWKKTTPFVKDDLEIQPLGNSAKNIDINFEVPKFAHFVLDMSLRTVHPPHTIAPAGNPANYVDFLGFADIDNFRVNFSSNLTYDRRKYDLYFNYRTANTSEKQTTQDQLIRGNRTIAQRTADLVNGVTTITDLDLPFSRHLSQALPIVVLSQKSRFTFHSEPLLNIINAPIAGTTVTPTGTYDYSLLTRVAHVTGDEADVVLEMSRAQAGIAYMIHQNVRQESDNTLTSTTTGQPVNIRLSSITKPLRFLRWALIPSKLNNNTGRNDFFFFAPTPIIGPVPPGMTPYNPIQTWSITANGQIIQRTIYRDWTRLWYWNKFHESIGGDEIFDQNYTEYPHSVNSAVGYLDYTNLNNPVLTIIVGAGGFGFDPDLGPPNAQQMTLIVNCEDYNFWYLHAGNWTRAFN